MVVFGGGSASAPWLRAKARSLRLPVFRFAAGEAVARSAAVIAGVAAGWWPARRRRPSPRSSRCQALLERNGGFEALPGMYERLLQVVAHRPRTRTVTTVDGQVQ